MFTGWVVNGAWQELPAAGFEPGTEMILQRCSDLFIFFPPAAHVKCTGRADEKERWREI